MIVRKNSTVTLFFAGLVGTGLLSGCTAIDENILKSELATTPAPVTQQNSAELMAARAAEAATSPVQNLGAPVLVAGATAPVSQAGLAAVPAGPPTLIPGTTTIAPIPALKESALAAAMPPSSASQALDMVASANAQPGAAIVASAQIGTVSPDGEAALTGLSGASTTVTPADPAASQQQPVELAYAAPLRRLALTSFGDPFDITPPGEPPQISLEPEADRETIGPTRLNALIRKYAEHYGVPEDLIHKVVHRESKYDPSAYSRGNYGLMQIRYNTAKAMGYRGPAEGLFDAETNIKYAVKYLKGAWIVADNSHSDAIRLYSRGYYFDAKRKGLTHLMH